MKNVLLLSIALLAAIGLFAQDKKLNREVFDSVSKLNIMIGYCTVAGITDTAFNNSLKDGFARYAPDSGIVRQIRPLLKDVTVTIVMGTWCDDSREQVPRFFKVIDLTGYPLPEPVIICTDRHKKAGDLSLEGMKIEKVPTFIINYKGKEIGRIVETPQTTLENDLLLILKKKQ